MNTVTLSFEKYIEKLNAGAIDTSATYEIEGNARIENKHELTATVDGHDIRVGYDGNTHSYLTLDGVTAARKLRWF